MKTHRNQPVYAQYWLMLLSFFASLVFQTAVPFTKATTGSIGLLETPSTITVTPNPVTLDIGATRQFTAVANFSSGSPSVDITSDAVWDSNNDSIATVTLTGLATAVSGGTATISATYGGKTGMATLNVNSPPTPIDGGNEQTGGGSVDDGGQEPGTDGQPSTGEEDGTGQENEGNLPGEDDQGNPAQEDRPGELPGPPAPGTEHGPGEIPRSTISSDGTRPGNRPSAEEAESGFQFTSPPLERPGEYQYQVSSVFLPDELSVTRGEMLRSMLDEFSLEDTYKDLLNNCYADLDTCLSIFLSVTKFDGVVIDDGNNSASLPPKGIAFTQSFFPSAFAQPLFDFGKTQLYPDVAPDDPYSYEINLATILAIVQGFYEEPGSPFKPYQVTSRIEALKVILGSVDILDWTFYPELETVLGGVEGVKAQKTPFADVNASRDYMWWYPRYINTACELKMIDCQQGSNFRPDDYITEAEFDDMIHRLRASLDESGYVTDLTSDTDNDSLKNYIEDSVYLTDPQNKDTDADNLFDGEEVKTFKTNPFRGDSDNEGLSDYDEVITYKTDPLKSDTDDDDFNDYLEVSAGTDPLNPKSFPVDEDTDGVADDWEQKYGFNVVDGTDDHDSDGISDKLEYEFGTDPTKIDSDEDGFTDAEEILQYGTDPLDKNSPGNLDNIGVRITNFSEAQFVGDTTPIIQGIAPLGSEVRVILRNDYGHEKILGSTNVDDNNVFIFQIKDPIRDGKYALLARALQPEQKKIVESLPVHIIIDSTLNVAPPAPKQLADEEITDEVLLKNLRIRIRDNRPELVGDTDFGNRVTASWRSVVTTSALIADAASGEFTIRAPSELELGNHEVYVTATRKKDNAQSETLKLLFNVVAPSATAGELKGAATEGGAGTLGSVFVSLGNFAKDQSFLFWLLIFVVVVIAGAVGYYFFSAKKRTKK